METGLLLGIGRVDNETTFDFTRIFCWDYVDQPLQQEIAWSKGAVSHLVLRARVSEQ